MAKADCPNDVNQRAKSIVDIATSEVEDKQSTDGKNESAVALGRLSGLKGGKARANSVTKEQRQENS